MQPSGALLPANRPPHALSFSGITAVIRVRSGGMFANVAAYKAEGKAVGESAGAASVLSHASSSSAGPMSESVKRPDSAPLSPRGNNGHLDSVQDVSPTFSNPRRKKAPTTHVKTHTNQVNGRRVVLCNVQGSIQTGEVLGVLGPSGSGKSTLLGVLTGSSSDLPMSSHLSGSLVFDGKAAG